MLQTAAGAGLAVTAVSALGVAASAAGAASADAATVPANASGHLVVHVRDLKTGDIEVFSGTTQTRVRDRALAARIAKAIS